jgi:hypothetical protein
MKKTALAFLSVALFSTSPLISAATITVDGWCLDVAREIGVGGNNAGREVVAWPGCHKGKNQQWKIENGLIKSNWNGKTWCLDVHMAAPIGAGRDVIVWPCHGGKNQKWEVKNGFIRSQANGWCLDRVAHLKIGWKKKGRNVIVWPHCHGQKNQKWAIQ